MESRVPIINVKGIIYLREPGIEITIYQNSCPIPGRTLVRSLRR